MTRNGKNELSDLGHMSRRDFMKGAAAWGGIALGGAGLLLSGVRNAQAATFEIRMQLGWLLSNGNIGEIVAEELGYFKEKNLSFKIVPGGPNVDGVASVASGRNNLGQVSSSPSLMLARSAGIPIKCIAAGYQRHPYTFFSLKSNPIRSAKDMIGRRIGVQATGRILLRALLAKNDIPESKVKIVTIGYDMNPLKNGQVDAITGWQTNTNALKVLGNDRVDLPLWDTGIRLYANPYYVTDDTLAKNRKELIAFMQASAKGWGWVYANQEKAVEMMVKKYPKMNLEQEKAAIVMIMGYVFNDVTKKEGWASMNPKNWQEQIDIYAQLKQFKGKVPTVDEVVSFDILNATAADRPKLG